MINLYNQDCLTFMKGLPDKAYELAIVDPEYGIGASEMQMGLGVKLWDRGKKWDASPPKPEYFTELFRVSSNQIIWGGNYFTLPISRGWVFWDKDVQPDLSFSSGELAWTSFDRILKKANIDYSGFRGSTGQKIHPTQKPVALYKWLLHNYAKPGDKIFDSHGGSGSILIAAYDLGFGIDWCELDKDYFDSAKSRFETHVAKYSPASDIPVTKQGQVKLF